MTAPTFSAAPPAPAAAPAAARMSPRLSQLTAYPFERLWALLAGARPPATLSNIPLYIGEPKHAPPPFVIEALRSHLHQLGSYPLTRGLPELRSAGAAALERRFLTPAATGVAHARLDPETMVLPVNGTREALFAFVQAVVDSTRPAVVAFPNPCYQIYEGAAILAGAEPYYLNTTAASRFLADLHAVPVDVWHRCQVLFLCSPGNPTGAVMSLEALMYALELAERHDFLIAADECYADLYTDESQPPPSLLAAAVRMGNDRFRRCVVFHSLSKRSSVPGLRSGLAAGDPDVLSRFLLYRTYHGCAMPVPTQMASIAAWNDDAYVIANRQVYQRKFDAVLPLLTPLFDIVHPEGGFYLWMDVRGDDERFTRQLLERTNVTILPGSYMARDAHGENPGLGRVRISLVSDLAQCLEATERIREFMRTRG
jgi:N-succinyldiaminopimelate aminotransferase